MLAPNQKLPWHTDTTTTYPIVRFDAPESNAKFKFDPPADAKEVASLDPDFGPAIKNPGHPNTTLKGQIAPDAVFESGGKKLSLNSYRGRPVLIDLWATWCGPCLISMPSLNRIYNDAKDKGLLVVSFDEDHDPEAASSYLARHHYSWTNYHDPDKSVQKALKGEGIPLTVLIDSEGKVVFYDFGGDEAELRKAIAGLGPQFASFASPGAGKP